MVLKLKDFIRQIRSCKTLADERALIAKESASIRTHFKEEATEYRHANVAKLLYMHMLGYPAHFGQMECVKLVASPRFADKRLGYLGIMLLLDEHQETLTLVTNSLKNDLSHSNPYIVGLALCTLGNISSEEMSRDLAPEVEKLLDRGAGASNGGPGSSASAYIRKKAALCALRIIRKVPSLMENFLNKARALLNERNHGVLLTGVTLMTELCLTNEQVLAESRKLVPTLVKHLKGMATAGHSPEHDVQGITDPFLQVKLLRLLRVLGTGHAEASEAMNDVLAQVATNTESSKNVGNSILYEAVLTIMAIKSEPTLRVLAVNILGKFLANKDNNIRYVALQTLNKSVVSLDSQSVQRHRATILDCLRDSDISIRRRALELAFSLCNETNIRVMTRELLQFLEIADMEFKPIMVTNICTAADRFAPNKRWHIDTIIRVMKLAGNHVREDILAQFIRLVTNTPELHAYTTHKLFWLVVAGDGEVGADAGSATATAIVAQEALVQTATWCIGEYGDIATKSVPSITGILGQTDDVAGDDAQKETPTEARVVDLLESLLTEPTSSPVVKEYALTALMKLSSRFNGSPTVESVPRVHALVRRFKTNMDLELQQRSVEYDNIFSLDPNIKLTLLERMPILELKDEQKYAKNAAAAAAESSTQQTSPTTKPVDELLNLGGLSLGAPATAAPIPAANAMDLMADIFGTASTAAPAAKPAANPLVDLLGTSPPKAASPAAPAPGAFSAFQNSDVQVSLTPSKDPTAPAVVNIMAVIRNTSFSAVTNFNFLVAVPKTQRLQVAPPSSNTIPAGSEVTQALKVANPEKRPVRLRLKVTYTIDGRNVDEMGEFGFPDNIV
ncbi:clathrin associated protein complex large subunit [Sorochytrium milnesiophthora]